MQIFGKALRAEQILKLQKAAELFNRYKKQHDPEHIDVTPEQYLLDLIDRQIAGLDEGIAVQEVLDEQTRQKAIRIDRAKQRLGL